MLNILMFGPPGAGKGTQSNKIIEKYKLTHISTGEILRKEIKTGSPLGIEAQKHIDKGYYVTDGIAIEIINKSLSYYKNPDGYIFDGFPRTTFQAQALTHILSSIGSDVSLMISIDVNEGVLKERLLNRYKDSGRVDDKTLEIIGKRISFYNQMTDCVKEYYKSIGKYKSIDGIGEIDVIFDKICKVIENYK